MEEKYLKHKERLRQRFIKEGLISFHDYEVLEMLLSYSLTRKDTKPAAKELIKHFGSISDVMNASVEELCKIEGISERTAVMIKMVRESGIYMMKDKITNTNYVSSSKDVCEFLFRYYKAEKIEGFVVIYLNTKNMIIKVEPLCKGTVNEARVYIRSLIENVIKYGASAIIVAHNHPSGSLDISADDIKLTKKLKDILLSIDVRLLDHLIFGLDSYVSLNDMRLL